MEPDPDEAKKEGRIARHSRLAREAWDEPTSVLRWSRDWLVRLWVTKGGGFYGLGYVIAFVSLEYRSITDELGQTSGVNDFIASQIVGYIIRFSFESFMNALLAVIWPFLLLTRLPAGGLFILAGAYLVYRYAVHPSLETWIPELKEAREAKERAQETNDAEQQSEKQP